MELFRQLFYLKREKFNILKSKIDFIIENNITDKNEIEFVLDYLIDSCFDDESISYYYKLCDYYEKIDKDGSNFYRKELKMFLD